MKIVYIKLVNFIGVNAAMGLTEIEESFDKIDKPIIQIYGRNRCGKTVLIQQLHPFSSINLNGDERSDLSLILPGETGIKNIVYEVDGEVYNITHTYKPTSGGNHTVSSSLIHDGKELNPSGGVTIFNSLIEKILGINKYAFAFIINGTQLTSFGNMSFNQRKNLLNKAMGIDIYDKIHKMATDDYRYTNKLITSLNNTKEYLLSTYGSYENLCLMLNEKRNECNELSNLISTTKSHLDSLSGQISVIRQQNVVEELNETTKLVIAYKNVVDEIGEFDGNAYDRLVEEQIALNNEISTLKNERLLIMKDIDVLYGKKNDIENTIRMNQKAVNDYNDMLSMRDDLKQKIDNINVEEYVTSSSDYLMSMMSMAQMINSTCKEIVTCLNDKHLKLFVDMVLQGIDISAFLVQEGSVLMDSEKEKSIVSRIRSMINSIDGEYIDDCCHTNCIYKKTHDTLETYFKSYQSATSSKFTQYDIEQFDHAYKNLRTIKGWLTNCSVSDELKDMFNIQSIVQNIGSDLLGIDVTRIRHLMEEAAKIESRNKYISQLSDIEKTIENMSKVVVKSENVDDVLNQISNDINGLKDKITEIENQLNNLTSRLNVNDKHRMMLSQVQHVDINELQRRQQKLTKLNDTLTMSEKEYSDLYVNYNEMTSRLSIMTRELEVLEKANNQYIDTTNEIEKYQSRDSRYKIIAEATSSTKGKPVIAIREKVENALVLTNKLLDVMYDGEIRLLKPVIDETTFSLPFCCNGNVSNDIRYGSQSESTLLSLALSLSLGSSLTTYNVPLVDEIDAYLDSTTRDDFVVMLSSMMSVLKMEQLFIISHNIQLGQYDHIVESVDISRFMNKENK